ncbi:hypothetical protein IFM89_020126 [Coptis chinensis]|uniref:RING-type E3 ubiquitin transferase n=1 Tax=Coptis chinensis TaxID=261450 RepID=A0A835IAZ1_9MAGN|nr:hypothetical protein IFM89_020126 [Coptis chinensis]
MNNKHHRSRTLTMSLFFFLLLQVLPYAIAQGSHSSLTPPNQSFKPSMTVTIVVLTVACVIIAFFSFYIHRCARDIHMDVVKGLKIGKELLECDVCLNEFEEDETLRLLPQCNHVFHPECIDAWLTSHTTFPVCRANLEVHSPSEATQVPGLLAPLPIP